MNNYAIDTAARFGEIPFVEFTKELVTGVFDSLVDAHLLQMEEYADFVASLTQDLSTYINDTVDGVTFEDVSGFISNYKLPEVDTTTLTTILDKLQAPTDDPVLDPTSEKPATTETWWGGLINALAPAVEDLVNKINDPSEQLAVQALNDYNLAVSNAATEATNLIPTYKQVYDSIAALIVSNKYGLLISIAKQGAMRLIVTEGEIETKITFSTWNESVNEKSFGNDVESKNKSKAKDVRGLNLGFLFRNKRKRKSTNRTITVNTAKSYQRDSSGTKVDIFGRVLIKFKTDYAPLNG